MKRPITIISSICSVLFLIAIAWFATGIYLDKKNGTQKAGDRYERLLAATKDNFLRNAYGTPEFSNNFIQAIGNIDEFSSLKLEINGELVYSYPPSTFGLPSPELVKSYSDTIYNGEKSLTLKASLYLMSPDSIYTHSRIAFLLILVGTLIAVVVIVLMNGTEGGSTYLFKSKKFRANEYKPFDFSEKLRQTKKQGETHFFGNGDDEAKSEENNKTEGEELPEPEASHSDAEKAESTSSEENSALFNPEQNESEENPQTEEKAIEFPREEPVFTEEDESLWTDDEVTQDADFPAGKSEENEESDDGGLDIIDQFEQENEQLSEEDFFADDDDSEEESENDDEFKISFEEEENSAQSEENPANEKISPITNLTLQAFLEQKFDELIQNGNTQATVALLKINGLDRGNAISQSVISILKNELLGANLFEYKSDAYAALLSATDLQTTVDEFEEIYNKITDYLKDNNTANEVSVGISSVSGRKVNAQRVLLEASQALDYASQDPDSPIVAFRANPQKYKEFQESENA